MSMSTAERPKTLSKVVRCDDCSSIFRNIEWCEGTRCPRCRSPRFLPLPIVGDAVDYVLADRTQGYALEDIRFAKIAQWSGLISTQQYHEAFSRQNEYISANAAAPPIGEIMRSARFLKKVEISAVLHYRCLERPDKDDAEFAKLAVQSGFLDQEKLAPCLEAQFQTKRLGHDVPPLPCLLYEKRLLQENQVLALLQKQAERNSGMAPAVRNYIQEHTSKPVEQLLGAKGSPQRRLRVTILGVLAVLVLAMAWRQFVHGPATMVRTQCINPGCGNIGAKPMNSEWPVRCEACTNHPRTVFPVSICERCGREFPNDKPRTPAPRCPRCGSTSVIVYITDKIDVRQIKESAKKNQ